ncbi:unnamed protein product [Symbiodinium sp. CCMP2592]|nr:unnamed protein product [Symbiodinium sp. CCMP2592]
MDTEEIGAPGERLVSWARTHGAFVCESAEFLVPSPLGDGDRTVRAKGDVAEGTQLLRLPRALAFALPQGSASGPLGVEPEFLEALQTEAARDFAEIKQRCPPSKNALVALLLCRERIRDSSPFGVYLDSLPKSFPTMPLLDDDPPWCQGATADVDDGTAGEDRPWIYRGTALEILAHAEAGLAGAEGIQAMQRLVASTRPFWPQEPPEAQLRWAAANVQSRAHAAQGGGTILIPLADCFNHSPTSPGFKERQL